MNQRASATATNGDEQPDTRDEWWLCDACKAGNCHFCRMPLRPGVCCHAD